MAPPKCFFKRPGQFYASGSMMIQPQKYESYSIPTSPISEIIPNSSFDEYKCSISSVKLEPNVFDFYKNNSSNIDKTNLTEQPTDSPLDLSCKLILPENNNILNKLSQLLQTKIDPNMLSNLNLNLESLFFQLPRKMNSNINLSPNKNCNPNIFISPPLISEPPWNSHQQISDKNLLNPDRLHDEFRMRNSPENSISVIDSGQENSSSETSSQCPNNQRRKRPNKRNLDSKTVRPFKLYKGNDTQSLLDALGVTEEDEEWLKSIIEHRNVDMFQFLSDVMSDIHRPDYLSDEIVEKIKLKFGHTFENCNSSVSNPRMVRHPDMTPKELKTEEYWEKRRKNNEAAKRSREARRQKEEGLTSHCEDLQMENEKIRKEIECVKLQIEDIKKLLS